MIKPFVFVTTLLLWLGPMALADEAAEAERLKVVIQSALDTIHDESFSEGSEKEKQSRVRSIIEEEYDLTVIIRRAIGRNWRLMDPDEQERVLELVKQLIVKAFVNGLDGKEYPDFSMGEVIRISDKRLEIPSSVTFGGNDYHIVYRLGKMRTGWQVYDIVAEDISVVSNYRQQIDDHFRNGTAEGLISKLEELLAKDSLDEDVKL